MAAFPDLELVADTPTDVHASHGLADGIKLHLQNNGGVGVRVYEGTSAAVVAANKGDLISKDGNIQWESAPGAGEQTWVYAVGGAGRIIVSEA